MGWCVGVGGDELWFVLGGGGRVFLCWFVLLVECFFVVGFVVMWVGKWCGVVGGLFLWVVLFVDGVGVGYFGWGGVKLVVEVVLVG